MDEPKPLLMQAVFRPKPGFEAALYELVERHWGVLDSVGLVAPEPKLLFRATDKPTGRPFYVEIFSWKDEASRNAAHQLPEVMAIWEPMGPMLEGGPSPELAYLEAVDG